MPSKTPSYQITYLSEAARNVYNTRLQYLAPHNLTGGQPGHVFPVDKHLVRRLHLVTTDYITLSSQSAHNFVIVTAANKNYFGQALKLDAGLQQQVPASSSLIWEDGMNFKLLW